MVRIIGYTADADVWCPDHAEEVYGPEKIGEWPREPRLDQEGNSVHPIFSHDERPIDDNGQHYDELCRVCVWEWVNAHRGFTVYTGPTLRD